MSFDPAIPLDILTTQSTASVSDPVFRMLARVRVRVMLGVRVRVRVGVEVQGWG